MLLVLKPSNISGGFLVGSKESSVSMFFRNMAFESVKFNGVNFHFLWHIFQINVITEFSNMAPLSFQLCANMKYLQNNRNYLRNQQQWTDRNHDNIHCREYFCARTT